MKELLKQLLHQKNKKFIRNLNKKMATLKEFLDDLQYATVDKSKNQVFCDKDGNKIILNSSDDDDKPKKSPTDENEIIILSDTDDLSDDVSTEPEFVLGKIELSLLETVRQNPNDKNAVDKLKKLLDENDDFLEWVIGTWTDTDEFFEEFDKFFSFNKNDDHESKSSSESEEEDDLLLFSDEDDDLMPLEVNDDPNRRIEWLDIDIEIHALESSKRKIEKQITSLKIKRSKV